MSGGTAYLLDTNVLSETRKRQSDAQVTAFLTASDASSLYTSVLVLGELRKGIAIREKSDRNAAKLLASWVDGLEYSFADRILPVDAASARLWGELSAERPRPVVDTLLAATALAHDLTLVTRNIADVRDIHRLRVLDPWTSAPSKR